MPQGPENRKPPAAAVNTVKRAHFFKLRRNLLAMVATLSYSRCPYNRPALARMVYSERP